MMASLSGAAEIVELSARQLITMLGSDEVAIHVVYALLDSSHTYRRKFSRLLVYMPAEEIRRSLQKLAESRNDAVAAVARELMIYLEPTLSVEFDEIAPVAGYISDSIPDSNEDLQDELGIKKDVKTLCSVLLAHDVKPPLAVGLFGDWGTGKSYFMQKMYWEIKDLSRRAAKASKTAYHSKVVQIRFNAWHYADASLWASLVSHIFDELSKEVSPAEDPEETKKKLLLQLESAKQARVEAEAEQKKAVNERALAEKSLEDIREKRKNSQIELSRLRLPDLMEVLTEREQHQLKTQLQDVLNALGLPAALNSVDELNGVYRQAFTIGGRIQAAMLSIWRSADRRLIVLLLVFAVVFFPLASWGFEKLVHSPFTAALNAFITEAALSLAAVAAPFRKGLAKVSQNLADFEGKRNRVFEVLDEKRKAVSEKELALRGELESLRSAEDAARGRVSDADAKVREIEQKLTDIREGRSLSRFLLERVQAEDYRKHLGLISVIRKDFERLDYLLTRGEEGLEKVGRIILYIDDLDRCPADKVVDVLQAIHLLLALPLFVAVVGVDLRWLLHSLDQQYTAFQSANNRRGTDRSLRPEWVTDPQNYLEKIFQIPFTLKTMQERGYEKLISVLMPEAKIAAGNEPKLADTYAGIGKKDGENHELERVQVFQEGTNEGVNGKNEKPDGVTDQEGEGESSADAADSDEDRDLDPEALMIKDWERAFAARMFPFIPTPRAAKRFTNTYRILKAPLTAKELVDFEGTSDKPGEFQAAMLLLGLATRFPREAMDLFPAIIQLKKTGGSWQGSIRDHMAVTEPQGEILEKIKLGNDPFVFWAPFVARFTFEAAKAIQSPLVAKSQQKRPLPSSFVGAASVFCLTLGRRNSKVNYFPPSEEKQ
jgi:ABC-type dipeptide/oligopeptide/nickel transport system ATPase component